MKESIKKKLEFLTEDKRKPKKRIVTSLIVHFFAVFSFVLYPSLEVYLRSPADFDFTITSMLLVMGVTSLILFALGFALSLILKGRLFNYYLTTVFSFSLGSYLQGAFLNGPIPALDGNAVNWHYLTLPALINLVIWFFIFLIPFIIHFFNRKFWRKSLIYVACLCIVMNAVSLVSLIFSSSISENANKGFYSNKNLYEASKDSDVLVFVLDYFDNEYMNTRLSEQPEMLSEWTGFTRFVNATSMYKQTMPSIPYLLTQSKWYCDTYNWDAAPDAFASSKFLERVDKTGAEIDLYVSGTANAKEAYNLADNYNSSGVAINPVGMVSSMANYLFFRNMPIISKSIFWHYTDDISNASVSTNNFSKDNTAYAINDAAFLDSLETEGLEITDKKSFKFIHMRGAHHPYEIDEKGEPSSNSYPYMQQRGSVYIVSQYLAAMKEKGVYDNTTIIIMADHGEVEVSEEMSRAALPILFVKPAGADSSAPIKTSTAPVSQEDFHATVLWALGDENYSDYGRTFFEIKENEERTRYFYYRIAFDGSEEESLAEYIITGDARDFSNWKPTGKIWGDRAKK